MEPDYKTFNSTTNEVINCVLAQNSFVDQEAFYQQKIFYGRQNTLKFKLCHEFCYSCYEYGISNGYQKCVTCLPENQYGFPNDDSSNCVPRGYFYDKVEKKLKLCDDTNSKYYFNKTNNKKNVLVIIMISLMNILILTLHQKNV